MAKNYTQSRTKAGKITYTLVSQIHIREYPSPRNNMSNTQNTFNIVIAQRRQDDGWDLQHDYSP